MNYESFMQDVHQIVDGFCKYTEVPAVIYGVTRTLTEREVRAIQVAVSRYTKAEFDDFVKNVVIYNGPKEMATEVMRIRRDGIFENEFLPGFYDSCTNMVFEIL